MKNFISFNEFLDQKDSNLNESFYLDSKEELDYHSSKYFKEIGRHVVKIGNKTVGIYLFGTTPSFGNTLGYITYTSYNMGHIQGPVSTGHQVYVYEFDDEKEAIKKVTSLFKSFKTT